MPYNEKIFNFILLILKKLPKYPWYYYLIGIIITIVLAHIIYDYLDEKFITRYGYPILEWDIIKLASSNGALLFVGTYWKEYAVESGKKVLYPQLLMWFAIFSFTLFILAIAIKFHKEKRKLGWLNVLLTVFLFMFLYVFAGFIIFFFIIFAIGGVSENKKISRKRRVDSNTEGNPYWLAQEQERINKEIPTINLKNDEYN